MRSTRKPDADRKERGFALPVALMLLFVMVVLVGALMGIVGQELREVAYTGFDNRALYLADAGIEAQVSQEEEQNPALASGLPQYYFPADSNGTQPSFLVTIKNHNDVNNRKTYLMQSEGITSEGYTRYVEAMSLEDTFADYNYAGWSNAPGNYFVAGLMQYNGPVYLGGGASNPVNIWWEDGASSIFLDKALVQGTLAWSGPNGHSAPQSQTDWTSVDSHGSSYFNTTNTAIAFPPDASGSVIATEALTGLPGNGTTMPSVSGGLGVYVNGTEALSGTNGNLNTGIYVDGSTSVQMTSTANTETIVFGTESSDPNPGNGGPSNPPPSIPNNVTVVVNYATNQTTVTEKSTTTTYTGVPSGPGTSDVGASANGAIFVNGDVTGLNGTVHGQQTIATNDNSSNSSENNVVVNGNINYQNDPQTCGCQSTDMLGIISHNVEVSSSAPSNLTIEAAVFAGNSYDYNHNTGLGTFETQSNVFGIAKKGPLLVYGSLVNASISPLGVFNSSNGQLANGWGDSYTWDARYKTTAPPFYPSLNTYSIIGWYDCGSNACP